MTEFDFRYIFSLNLIDFEAEELTGVDEAEEKVAGQNNIGRYAQLVIFVEESLEFLFCGDFGVGQHIAGMALPTGELACADTMSVGDC